MYWGKLSFLEKTIEYKSVEMLLKKNDILFYGTVLILVLWFAGQSQYFLWKIGRSVQPDENYHIDLINEAALSDNFFLKDNWRTFQHGAVSRGNTLYHVLAGKLKWLAPSSLGDRYYARFISWLFAFGAFLFLVATLLHSVQNRFAVVLAILFASNTLMLSFISAAATYDSPINFFSAMAIYFLVRFLLGRKFEHFLWTIAAVSAGCCFKITALPLALEFVFVLVVLAYFGYYSHLKNMYALRNRLSTWSALFVLVLSISYNISLYGVNLAQFGELVPNCGKVLPAASCMKNAQYRRDIDLQNSVVDQTEIMTRLEAFPRFYDETLRGAVGILCHKRGLTKSNRVDLQRYYVTLWLFLLVGLIQFRKLYKDNLWLVHLFIASGYLFVLFWHNYNGYLSTGYFGPGIQGRYVFPVMTSIYTVVAVVLMSPQVFIYRIAILLLAAFYWIDGAFFYFLKNVTPPWLSG